ncbi:MAG: hypothetical protein R2706_05560 [Acidimicrobiales bacterium]
MALTDWAAGGGRPFVERANPIYPSLVDSEHRIDAILGNIANAPMAVWIDEAETCSTG